MTDQLPSYLQEYFDHLNDETQRAFSLAQRARKLGYDPAPVPEIQIAKNMAERVVGLVSVSAPQIVGSGIVERIQALEAEYGILDWRVAMVISLEVSQQKYCRFTDEREAMEVGIRIGFAYVTNGVVSSPLEGFVNLELIDRNDGTGKFFRINYAGPVRNAGGTAAATSVVIADYVRKHMGYAEYDPTEDEIKRCHVEISDYHDRVTNLQYFPSTEETEFMLAHMPVEVAGDPTEKVEVSNYKNLPRIPTNKLRSGYCLIYSSCIPLKAPKLWKKLAKWGASMGMEHWSFLEEFIHIQHEQKSKSGSAEKQVEEDAPKISPVYTYISDLVAGRPVFGHPLRPGAFRLRYGRSRLSGLSGQAVHPATMIIANEFIATATQLKVERPGKAAAYTSCDCIEGPIVRLKNGRVLQVETTAQAKMLTDEVEKILFLGDVLVAYGDFLDRAHPLVPVGYCEEWWVQDLKASGAPLPQDLWDNPLGTKVTFKEALAYSKEYQVPLHPKFTYYYLLASVPQLTLLWEAIKKAPHRDNLVLAYSSELKEVLEIMGVPHEFVQDEFLVMRGDVADAVRVAFAREINPEASTSAEFMQSVSSVFLQDKAGTFIGSRMGRPEKAKMRKMKGSPHSLFPVGEEGGRLRSFNEALNGKQITSSFEVYTCTSTGKEVVLPISPYNDLPATPLPRSEDRYPSSDPDAKTSPKHMSVPIDEYFQYCLTKLGMDVYPDLIKGVRGSVNDDRTVEHLAKGILRAHYDVHVNKDGTVRYDASEVPITHFRPQEIGITASKARDLGYEIDIHGNAIERDDQVIEMFPQDVVLPACDESPDERADDVLLRVANFVDDLLTKFYGLEPYYSAKKPLDLVGHFIIALAPHTSAGTIGRIIGFSKTQGLFYHPYLHCATRRDCDGDEGCVFLMMDAFLNFSRRYLPSSRGGTMDAPLVLATTLDPAEVDDMVLNVDIAWRYPLELYEKANEFAMPWEVQVPVIQHVLGTPKQFYGMGFTHDTWDVNDGNRVSSYKTLPTMHDKLQSQMALALKLSAVDERDVARLVIEKHFIRDLKGNLRKFSMQIFRCVKCNAKYRRPPLAGNCTACRGRIIFTISEGSVVKYLGPAESLVKAYNLDTYLAQTIELTRRRVEEVFGRDPEKQLGLGEWFS